MMNDLLASSIPGRIRLRGVRLRSPAGLDGLQRRLQVQPGVVSVSTNARVGSLLIRYDPIRLPQSELLGRLQPLLDRHLPARRAGVRDAAGPENATLATGPGQGAVRNPPQTGDEAAGLMVSEAAGTGTSGQVPWKGWWALQAERQVTEARKPAVASRSPVATRHRSTRSGRQEKKSARGWLCAALTKARGLTGLARRGSVSGGVAEGGIQTSVPSLPASRQVAVRPRRRNWRKTANQVAKQGMLLSLGSSLGLVAAGARKGHAVTGSAFVGLLGVHLAIHRKSLFK